MKIRTDTNRRRGFSLLEVAVASAMAGIIATAAIAAFAQINRQLTRFQLESRVTDDAKTLVDLLVSDLQAVGGGPVRPWMALLVEDGGSAAFNSRAANFDQGGGARSDRVTYATLIPEAPQCTIQAIAGSTGKSGTITGEGADFTCCLGQLVARAGILGGRANTYAIVDQRWRQLSLTSITLNNCTASWIEGPLSILDDPPPGGDASFVDGAVVAVKIKTVYHHPGDNELRLFEEAGSFNGMDVSLDPGEVTRLASDVFDFQVQLGYDTEPDGRILDNRSSADEWLYNTVGESTAFRIADIRMVGIGTVIGVGVVDDSYQSTAQVLGGPVITLKRFHLRGAMGRAALRNIFVFF